MTSPEPEVHDSTEAMLRAAGITVTEEGKAAARERRLAAAERRTPAVRRALREQLRRSSGVA